MLKKRETGSSGAFDVSSIVPADVVMAPVQGYRDASRIGLRAMREGFIDNFYKSNNLTFAASIAYYTLLSMFPFLLLVLSIVSRLAVVYPEGGGQPLLQIIVQALPSRFEFLTNHVQELAAASLNLSVATMVIMLWAAMGMFGAVTSAVNHAWGVERDYGFFQHKLIAFLMMVAAGLLAVTALTLGSAAQVVQAGWFAGVLAQFPQLAHLTGFVSRNAATPLFILVVGLIYYIVPNTRVRLRDVWFGAVLAGLLWRITFAGFSWYVRDLSRFNVHGSVAAVVVFLLWVYVSAVIFLYGVEVTAAYARLLREGVERQA